VIRRLCNKPTTSSERYGNQPSLPLSPTQRSSLSRERSISKIFRKLVILKKKLKEEEEEEEEEVIRHKEDNQGNGREKVEK
jgi:hypothetical protein